MRKTIIILSALCILFSVPFLCVQGEAQERGWEIFGDEAYTGKFDGFKDDTLYIKLDRTGERIALPLAEEVEFLYKPNNYAPYDPQKLIFQSTIKAIVVEEKVVQVIVLEVPS